MTPRERDQLIDQYGQGVDAVMRSLDGFPASGLTQHPIAGKWSAAEIAHHLADSETTAALRLRRLLVEERPIIHGYDQEGFARVLRYNERPIEPALVAFRAARECTLQVLRQMRADDWTREGWHTEAGLYTPETWLDIYSRHAHGHAFQITRLREALPR